jgi:hypothetical protein
MKCRTDRILATAIGCSIAIHFLVASSPYAWRLFGIHPAGKTTTPPPVYPLMIKKGVTTAWLIPPKKIPPPLPKPAPQVVEQKDPIATPATMEPDVYDAAELTDSPQPVGKVTLDNFPNGVSTRGSVELTLLISPAGEVLDISAANSTMTHQALDLTLDAFRSTHFRPGTMNGNPVSSRIKIVVNLESEE